LFINACIRGNSVSRTYQLAQHFISEYKKHHKESSIVELNLMEMNMTHLTNDRLNEREALLDKEDYDNPVFKLANQFAEADRIIIAAPFWDLNFPALLKIYFVFCNKKFLESAKSFPQAPVGNFFVTPAKQVRPSYAHFPPQK